MSRNLESLVLGMDPGIVFDIDDIIDLLKGKTRSRNYITVTLSKLYKQKKVAKTVNGKYYIPKEGILAPLPISKEEDIIQRYITDQDSVYGVFSGYRILNKWGFTQHYASRKEVVTNHVNIRYYYMKKLNVRLKKSKFAITKNNYRIAEFFEVLKSYEEKAINENIDHIEYRIANYVNKNFSEREKIEVVYYLYTFESSITKNKFMKVYDYLDDSIKRVERIYRRDEIEAASEPGTVRTTSDANGNHERD